MEATLYDWSSAVCKLQFDELYSVINTDTFPMLINPDGTFHTYKIVAFGPKSLDIERLGSRFSIMYRFGEGVDAHAVSKKILKSIGLPDTILRSASGLIGTSRSRTDDHSNCNRALYH